MNTVDAKIETLNKAIELIAKDVKSAVALHQMYERCANSDDIIQSVNGTKRAWGFGVVRNALLVELVITLMRIHDSGRKDNASLENIMNILADWRVREHLVKDAIEKYRTRDVYIAPTRSTGLSDKERRDRDNEIRDITQREREAEAPNAGKSVEIWLDEAFSLYDKLHQEAAQKSLKKLRNWQIAHQAIDKAGKHGATYGDQKKLLDLTVPLFQKVATVINGMDYGLSDLDECWADFSDAFWRSMIKPAKKRKATSNKN